MSHSIIKILNAYKEFIEKRFETDNYKLIKAPKVDTQDETEVYVVPKVTTGCLPHANFSLYGADNVFFQAPYVLVGYEEVQNDEDEISIIIQTCCYSSGKYITDTCDDRYSLNIPDNHAFEDVTLLLEYISNILRTEISIAGSVIEKPMSLGSYNTKELTYPYSFGYLRFTIKYLSVTSMRNKIEY